jgi:hypothetical protein
MDDQHCDVGMIAQAGGDGATGGDPAGTATHRAPATY